MCLAAAFLNVEKGEPVLKDIAQVAISGNTVTLTTLFGENKVIHGKLQEVDFVNSRIIIKQ